MSIRREWAKISSALSSIQSYGVVSYLPPCATLATKANVYIETQDILEASWAFVRERDSLEFEAAYTFVIAPLLEHEIWVHVATDNLECDEATMDSSL